MGRELALIAMVLVACAPTRSAAPAAGAGSAGESPPSIKVLTVGQLTPITAFTPEGFSNTGGGGPSLAEIYAAGLVSADKRGNLEPRIAERLPSLDDGSITLLPDGRMRTTWKLREDVRWHDGHAFSADDVVFSWEMVRDPNVLAPGAGQAVKGLVESAEALDPTTAVLTWKTTYIHATELGTLQFWLYPRHLLGQVFQGDKQSFLSQPFFTTEFVGLGPFRMIDFGGGEALLYERFDAYFLGRSKLDRLLIRVITDPNVLFTNVQAGAVEVLADRTLSASTSLQLRDGWAQNGGGSVVSRQDLWWYLWVQMDPQIAQPADVARDARIRRALLFGIDRAALREFLFPGVPGTDADTFLLDGDRRGPIVGQPFARYPYDPARATRELGEAGWSPGPDRRLVDRDGTTVQLEIRGDQTNAPEVAAIAANWRQLGIDVSESPITPIQARDSEYTAHFPAFLGRARGTADTIFPNFDGRQHSTAQNRWQGANHGHYANADLDRLIDRVNGALDEREQGLILRELGEIMATDLPALPIYFRINFGAVARGVSVAAEDYAGSRGTTGPGLMSRNAHLWDRNL